MADIVINPVATAFRNFTYPPPRPDGSSWPGTKTNIWIDVYWFLDIPGTYRFQRTNDGVEWAEHGVPIVVKEGQPQQPTDSVDQFPNGQLTWKRIVRAT